MKMKTRKAGCLFKLIKLFILTAIIAGLILYFSISYIVPSVVHYSGKMVGVDMGLGSFRFSVLNQDVELKNFYINNPEGFKKDTKVLNLDRVKVDLDLGVSDVLFKDLIVIDEVAVEGFEFFLEYAEGMAVLTNDSNLNALLAKVKSEEAKEEAKEEAQEKAQEASPTEASSNKEYKVIIKKLVFKNGKIAGGLYGTKVDMPLPDFEILDVGVAEGGVSPLSAGLTILSGISYQAMTALAKSAGGAASDAGKAIGDAASDAGKAVGGALESGFESVKSIFDGF